MTQDNLNDLRLIESLAQHHIPFYAYGDNEAACELARRLKRIETLLFPILQEAEEEEENFPLDDAANWIDPAGGTHSADEEDPLKIYE